MNADGHNVASFRECHFIMLQTAWFYNPRNPTERMVAGRVFDERIQFNADVLW